MAGVQDQQHAEATIEAVTVAAVQAAPVFLDRDLTVEKACGLIAEAGRHGAGLVVFPEAFVPGYPDWVWRTRAWKDDQWYARLLAHAVTVGSDATDRLGEAARLAGAWVAIGINELDRASRTIFNSLLYLAPDGTVAGCHRKVMPTGGERTVWGTGDGSTLDVFETRFGRLGGLLCWENYMPLARAAMYAQRVDVYLAPTWDNADAWIATLRHIAKEGRTFVIGTNSCIRAGDIGADLPGRDDLYHRDDAWVSRGNTTIVGPDGDIIAGPLTETEGVLYADIDVTVAHRSRREFDPVGHYARPDIFHLDVDARPKLAATFSV
ncbi:MAG TPA: carbon-nitrogen hydrolase family protein [Acidimicrobiales bacterium]|nr:carbon-nitrogen hydrolase family protein [Acidimicrobiales bacterium]